MMKWLALLLVSLSAGAQQQNVSQIPDCSLGFCAGLGVPTFSCNSGQKYAEVNNAGVNYTCTGIPAHWVQDAGSGGTSISLTTSGSSGAATLSGSILNIPVYQAALTLTTTGSSGAATLSGATLNIPQYAGGVTSIDSQTGAFTFTGSGVSHVGNAYTFTNSGGSMSWPALAGIPNYNGSSAWGTSYSSTNLIPANFISTLNQNTTGNAATATALAATPAQCSSSQFATGITAAGTANCGTPSGSGNTTSTSLTTSSLTKASGANSIINSLFTDNGTNGAYTGSGGFSSTGPISSGATPPTACGSATGCVALTDAATAGTPVSGQSYIRADSVSGGLLYSFNGGAETPFGTGSGVAYPSATNNAVPGASISGGVTTLVDTSFSDDTTNTFDSEPFYLVGEYQQAVGTANSSNNYVSNVTNWLISYWNGTTAVSASWNVYAWVAQGAAPPASVLTYYAPANLTSTAVLYAIDPGLIATGSVNYSSPKFKVRGNSYNGTTGILDDWNWQGIYGTGANPTTTLQFTHSGTSGSATVEMPGLKLDGTPEIASGTSSNSDVSGELALSSATTASYTFSNTYSSHPECVFDPQFSTTVAHWVTYTGTTAFTINFASAVTGSASYICIARN